jgi:hypothetical protein
MKTMKFRTVKGKEITVAAEVVGYDQTGTIPILDIPQMSDQQWEELAKGGALCQS